MDDFWHFASEHPIATVLIATAAFSALVSLVPWGRRDRGED